MDRIERLLSRLVSLHYDIEHPEWDGAISKAELHRRREREEGEYQQTYRQIANEYRDLLAALEEAREAIASLPIDALGSGKDGELEWSIRDELIDKISRPIAKARGE